MAKNAKYAAGKVKTRTLGGGKGKRGDLPVDSAPSNAIGDKRANLIFMGVIALSVIFVFAGLYFALTNIISGFNGGHHINWLSAVIGAAIAGATFFIARSLLWLSYFAAIMYAFKTHSFESMERLCREALRRWKLFPGGSATAALLLVQSLVSRGRFDDAIEVGQQQWELHNQDKKFNETLAPMYASIGMAHQVKGDVKGSLTWTERGIEAMERSLADVAAKKTWQAKLAGAQAAEWQGQLKMQLCVAYFNNATSYFNMQNHRMAKQQYKQALDFANQAPDFKEKSDIVHVSREQMARLKHV